MTTVPRLKNGEIVAKRFRIDGVVGRGGFGAVYRATDTRADRSVALKVMIKDYTRGDVDLKRFKREAKLVQQLHHDNVVEILDVGQTERGEAYIAFELLEGRALSAVLKDVGALPLDRAGEIARDVLSALAAAHAMGIIHRDIKPQNVFLTVQGPAKVLDFGIAKAVAEEEAGATQLTEAGQMIGTPHYMAPEQVRGTGVVPASDLYAVGLMLAEMVTGQRVVSGNALIEIYMAHISDEPLEIDEAAKRSPYWTVIQRATEKELDDRYDDAKAMLADVRDVLRQLEMQTIKGTVDLESLDLDNARTQLFDDAKRAALGAQVFAAAGAGGDSAAGEEAAANSDETETGTLLMDREALDDNAQRIHAALQAKKRVDMTVPITDFSSALSDSGPWSRSDKPFSSKRAKPSLADSAYQQEDPDEDVRTRAISDMSFALTPNSLAGSQREGQTSSPHVGAGQSALESLAAQPASLRRDRSISSIDALQADAARPSSGSRPPVSLTSSRPRRDSGRDVASSHAPIDSAAISAATSQAAPRSRATLIAIIVVLAALIVALIIWAPWAAA